MVVDDNKYYIDAFFKFIIRGNHNIRLTELSYDGIHALSSIIELKPDVIILDLDLPKLNGMQILEELQKNNINTNIIVLSARLDLIAKVKLDNNVKYIIPKTSGFPAILDAIKSISANIEETYCEEKINAEFKRFGFNMNSLGTKYLIRAILLARNNEEFLKNIEKNLYAKVGIIFNSRKEKVKWNINRAIQSMWRYTPNSIETSDFFNRRNSEKPSASDVINTMVSYLNSNIEKM